MPTVAAVGSDLYDGSAGIALFLGQLYAHTNEALTKVIALEAINHALDESKRSSSTLGLYNGATGIAFVAARLALLLDAPTLAARARYLVERLTTQSFDDALCDVIGGAAGTIIGLLALPAQSRERQHLDICERLGQALVDAATPWKDTWAWTAKRAMGEAHGVEASQPLVGFSHGASGIGLALLALEAKVGNPRFGEVGKGAFAYERLVFDSKQNNWPDFRILGPSTQQRFAYGWCHGASGIALARRYALGLNEDPTWRVDLKTAVDGSRRAVRDFHEPGTDVTLCHGLAGYLEPLLEAGEHEEVAKHWEPLVERFGERGNWPSGMPSRGPNPSLMLGTAGVGYTFLRMHDPTTPSVLLPLLGSHGG